MSFTHVLTGLFRRTRSSGSARVQPSTTEAPAVRHCLMALRDMVYMRGSDALDPGRASVANDLAAILHKIDLAAFSVMKWRVVESFQDQIVVAEYITMADAKIGRHGTESECAAWRMFKETHRPEILLSLLVSFMAPAQKAGAFMADRIGEWRVEPTQSISTTVKPQARPLHALGLSQEMAP